MPEIIAFDVNETLLDLSALDPLFVTIRVSEHQQMCVQRPKQGLEHRGGHLWITNENALLMSMGNQMRRSRLQSWNSRSWAVNLVLGLKPGGFGGPHG